MYNKWHIVCSTRSLTYHVVWHFKCATLHQLEKECRHNFILWRRLQVFSKYEKASVRDVVGVGGVGRGREIRVESPRCEMKVCLFMCLFIEIWELKMCAGNFTISLPPTRENRSYMCGGESSLCHILLNMLCNIK